MIFMPFAWSRALFPGPIAPNVNPETETDGPSSDLVRTLDKADSHLAAISEAIQHVDQKKPELSRGIVLNDFGLGFNCPSPG
jgi:hypothetical protein